MTGDHARAFTRWAEIMADLIRREDMPDAEYLLAVEYDAVGRPDPPYADRECLFVGVAPTARAETDIPMWDIRAAE